MCEQEGKGKRNERRRTSFFFAKKSENQVFRDEEKLIKSDAKIKFESLGSG